MLHNEARELLAEAYEKCKDAKRVAEDFGVSESCVYHLVMQKRRTGSVAVRTSQRGRKPVLSAQDKENVRRCIDERPDVTIEEIREKLGLSPSYSTVERAVNAMGYMFNKEAAPCR